MSTMLPSPSLSGCRCRTAHSRALAVSWGLAFAVCAAAAGPLPAQPPVPQDTVPPHGDTLTRPPVLLQAVTITARAPQREEASGAITVTPTAMERTLAANPYDLLRLSAGIEVHDQGQGPGFASNAAVRGFSSDHSTDVALWIDGVPINEPVNGHAEGYADWSRSARGRAMSAS